MAKTIVIEVATPPFRVAFPELVEPSDFGDNLEYNLQALFPNTTDMAWFQNALVECAQKNQLINPQGQWITDKYPQIKDGNTCVTKDTGEIYDGYKDHLVLKFKSSSDKSKNPFPMDIIDTQNNQMDAKDIYGGCWCRAIIKIMRLNHPTFGTSISMRCDNLQFLGHGEPLGGGGRVSSIKAFAKVGEPVGLPEHVSANPVTPAPTAAPGMPPQATAPGMPPQATAPGMPPQATAPGMPPQATAPAPTAAPGMPPGQFANNFMGQPEAAAPPAPSTPEMGPNAQGFTYEQWIAAGYNDDQMRAQGIIV